MLTVSLSHKVEEILLKKKKKEWLPKWLLVVEDHKVNVGFRG